EGLAGAGAGGVESETSRVAESIEHAPAGTKSRDGPPVVALVEVEPGLLALSEMHEKTKAALLDDNRLGGGPPPPGAVLEVQPLHGAEAALGAQVNPIHPGQVHQKAGKRLAPLRDPERGELQDQPVVVAIDRAAGEAVAFAENQPAGAPGAGQPQDVLP